MSMIHNGNTDGTVDIAVMQVDYTTRELQDGTKTAIIHVYGRNREGELEHVRIHGFVPYFYAPTNSIRDADIDPKSMRGGYTGIRGTDLTKITAEIPRYIGYMREEFDKTFEADVRFPNRFLIDKGIKSGIRVPENRSNGRIDCHESEVEPVDIQKQPRVNMFDIEVEDRNGFPENGEEPILCITSWDSKLDEYVIWAYDPEADERVDEIFPSHEDRGDGKYLYKPDTDEFFPEYDPIQSDSIDYRIAVFEEEAEMIENFTEYIEVTDPDCLSGWNFDDFDAPYFLDRMEKLNEQTDEYDLDIDRLSRIGEVWRNDYSIDLKGRAVFDLLDAYKGTKFSEMESYRLDAIGEVELGIGKEHYDGDIGDLWEDDFYQLLEYNLRDVELCVELDKQQSIIDFWNEVRTFVGCKIEDATTASDAVDMYVLHKVNGDIVLPSKGQAEYEDFEGGAVFEPISGVKKNVNVLDLKSLYPMCMVTINASPETKIEDPESYDGKTYQSPEIEIDGETKRIHFQKNPDGIVRGIVDELLEEREEKKAERNKHDPKTDAYDKFDRQQAAIKVIMNSLYGVLGWEKFRLYDKEMGAAVTATGRAVINHTEKTTNDMGYEVTYGDTDSVMLSLGDIEQSDIGTITSSMREQHPELVGEDDSLVLGDKFKQAYPDKDEQELSELAAVIAKGFEIEEKINSAYDTFAERELNVPAEEHRFLIENEKLYRRFFQAGKKKRYAGHIIWKEGKYVDDVDITGFEAERSDVAPITERVQSKVIEKIVYGHDKSDIKQYTHGIVEDFRDGDVSLNEIGIPGGIGQELLEYDTPTAQVRGAMYANLLLGQNLTAGSKPKRVYLRKVHPDYYENFDPDFSTSREQELYTEFKRDPDVICFEYESQVPDYFKVDYDKMLQKTVKKPVARVLESIGITWQEVKSNQTQTGFEEYM